MSSWEAFDLLTRMPATAPSTLRAAVHCPCFSCNAHELAVLQDQMDNKAAHWEYSLEVPTSCPRCNNLPITLPDKVKVAILGSAWILVERLLARAPMPALAWKYALASKVKGMVLWASRLIILYCLPKLLERIRTSESGMKRVKVPISMDSVSLIERVMGAATVSEKGSKLRPYGSFISFLTTLEATGEFKTALQVWAPLAIGGFLELQPGVTRRALPGETRIAEDPPETQDAIEGNADLNGSGEMPGTTVPRDSYADDAIYQQHQKCIKSEHTADKPGSRILAHQIGPNLRNAECFESTNDNIAAAIDNRFQAPPFQANGRLKARINKTIDAIISEVFPAKKVREWRIGLPKDDCFTLNNFEDMHSKKWTQDRFARAVDEALADTEARIEQTFQIKTNEVQDSGKKLPRPRIIIQCGDEAQAKMLLPVKCFEDLLFKHFKEASIKSGTKHDSMMRIAKHLAQSEHCCTIEGDGSSWDACCNEQIRDLTENRILRHLIEILGFDAEVPNAWMIETLEDMKQSKLKSNKTKTIDAVLGKTKIKINAIRQSGHRGTSAFNYLINLTNWLSVLAENPDELIKKIWNPSKKSWVLPRKYISSYDGCEYSLRYAFEGDDSALTSTEDLKAEGRAGDILNSWTSLGFKMKLVYAEKKLTFTGFNFLMAKNGPKATFMPEIKRNIASSSWTTSPEVRQFPDKLNRVAAAAFLARAENFKDCEPLCHYFAALGKSHALRCGSFKIGEDEAIQLGILPGAIMERLDAVVANTHPLTQQERALITAEVGEVLEEKWIGLTNCYIEDPFDTAHIKHLLPKQVWFEASSPKIRPRGADEQLLINCR